MSPHKYVYFFLLVISFAMIYEQNHLQKIIIIMISILFPIIITQAFN